MALVYGASSAIVCWLLLLRALFAEVGAATMWTKHTGNWAVLVCTSRYWYVYLHLLRVLNIVLSWISHFESVGAEKLGVRVLGFRVLLSVWLMVH